MLDHSQAMNFLVIQLKQLGDILLTTPCLQAIKEANPNHKVTFVGYKIAHKLLDRNPHIDELILVDDKGSFFDQFSEIWALRNKRFHAVIDFMNNPRSALISAIVKSPYKLAYRSARGLCYSHLLNRPSEPLYIVQEKFRFLEKLGLKPENKKLTLVLSKTSQKKAEDFFVPFQKSLKVILSPTHRRDMRRWSVDGYIGLAQKLVEQWNAEVFWAWGPGELDLVQSFQSKCSVPTHLLPNTTMLELAAMIGAADLFIGNSNGPSHLAVAVDTPSLQIHGHTLASSWCPLNQRHQAIQGPRTMADISLETVWRKLQLSFQDSLQGAKCSKPTFS